jgi:hypothetical protein
VSCKPIQMEDGSVVLANVKRGAVLTQEDKRILAEWVQFCRDRRAAEQRKRNAALLPGAKGGV